MRRTVVTGHVEDRVVELYSSGYSIAEVAFSLRVGFTPVRNALLRRGVALRGRGRPKERAS